FPEPDLLPLEVDDEWIDGIRTKMVELPLERERRFRKEYNLSSYDASVLCSEKKIADYYEELASIAGDPKLSANWMMREVMEELKEQSVSIEQFSLQPERLAGLIRLVKENVVSGSAARDVFKEMVKSNESAEEVVRRLGLEQISGEGELEKMIDEVIAENPREVERYREGKIQLLGFFVGQVMKKSRGKANPKLTGEIIKRKLSG
ncbi:Asp-tRNA(Asn)/Glu-tRNA(Gln) amidotransferase GatCAB subunit B, partial [bacterium]